MPIGNEILRWLFIILLAYGYGSLVLYIFKLEKDNHIIPLSIGAIGILIGYFTPFLNISRIFYIGGIPLLITLNLLFTPTILWSAIALGGWGIGFGAHLLIAKLTQPK